MIFPASKRLFDEFRRKTDPFMVFKEIPLHPTLITLDVIISDNKPAVCEFLHRRYGEDVSYYERQVEGPICCSITAYGEKRIVVILKSKDDVAVMAHEVVHATWLLNKICGLGFDYKCNEVQAYYVSYIISEILK